MFSIVGRAAMVLALCLAIGLHWCAVQSVAWTSMMVEYSQKSSLTEALAKTFDGKHPCSLCHAVQVGQRSEKKSDLQSLAPKIDLICNARVIRFTPGLQNFLYSPFSSLVNRRSHSPLVPPPRVVVG